MGQYYRAVVKGEEETIVYNRDVNGYATPSKLTQHSWWDSYFVNYVTMTLLHSPKRVGWVGDYADRDGWSFAWKDPDVGVGIFCEEKPDTLDHKYLVNHDKKEVLDCDAYKEASDPDSSGDILHPLPLLTAIGNGQGGGDYYSEICDDEIGTWAGDLISVETECPEDYQLVDIFFFECD